MDWLKSILQLLPLDTISDILGEITIWWSQLVKDVPAADLPMYAYIGFTIIVLLLWLLVARMLPKPLGGMTWMLIFAVLLAPSTALGDPSQIAPASIAVIYALMMKDTAMAISNLLPILVVLVVGLFIGFVWQLIRGAFESSLDKARQRSAEDTKATMQLTTGNYLVQDSAVPSNEIPVATPQAAPKTATNVPPKKIREGFYTKDVNKNIAAEKVVAKAKNSKAPAVDQSSSKKPVAETEVKDPKL
ncbi:hypothetical protein [Psychrobacter jeotgali]|uniref:hypothetical protein n=1 Tax=Psychrobacter jeotgali TaxID=179010 RepID=UPI001D1045A3|nr:hypothetical protein [Psychrobacter jeotgali]